MSFFDILYVRIPLSIYDKSILYETEGATQRGKNHEDLDHKINTLHAQSEAEREKALFDLIVDIIIKATLKEYYETNNCLETSKNRINIYAQMKVGRQ